ARAQGQPQIDRRAGAFGEKEGEVVVNRQPVVGRVAVPAGLDLARPVAQERREVVARGRRLEATGARTGVEPRGLFVGRALADDVALELALERAVRQLEP